MREVICGLLWFDFAGQKPFKRAAWPGILASSGLRKPLMAVLATMVIRMFSRVRRAQWGFKVLRISLKICFDETPQSFIFATPFLSSSVG
jgi:hypothetical protein